jgi:hypothetical protein
MKTIPRSIRAGIALVVSIVLFSAGLDGLQALVAPGGHSGMDTLKCIGGLLIGTIATVIFYYFQALDGEGSGKGYSEIETLNSYQQSQKEEERYKNVDITPAYGENVHSESPKSADNTLKKPN